MYMIVYCYGTRTPTPLRLLMLWLHFFFPLLKLQILSMVIAMVLLVASCGWLSISLRIPIIIRHLIFRVPKKGT